MTRRELLALAALPAVRAEEKADYKLVIGQTSLEIAPNTVIKTLAYNGSSPGPLLRMKEGQRITIEVENRTQEEEIVHWHGLHIPPDVDGSMEEGTPMIPAGGRARYSFIPRPSGTRWYHTHTGAMRNLKRGLYSGQFGFIYVEPKSDPGAYDQEVFLAIHEWEPYFTTMADSMDILYKHGSINGRTLGFGDPVRVKHGQKVMLRILNASATLHRRIAFAGHSFTVVALDGNRVTTEKNVPVLELGPAERIDALVEMNQPGVWILGSTDERERKSGLGIIFEYAGKAAPAQWVTPSKARWDYTIFGGPGNSEPFERIPLVIEKKFAGSRWVDKWTINGKSWPKTDPIRVRSGHRYRLVFDNRSDEPHPLHLHRHTFELRNLGGNPTAGVFKDVVVVQPKSVSEVELIANNPGKTLFHCHQQMHMDFGFMALMEYV